ncbi:MAG: hypothetical protein WCG97_01120 [bacterium]
MKYLSKKRGNTKSKKPNHQGGQVLIATVILFLSLSLAVVLGMAIPIANQIKVSGDLETSRRSYATAEVGNEEIYYRLNKGKTIPASIVLGTSNATATAVIVDNGDSETVTSTGLSGTYQRLTKTIFTRPRSVSMLYAMQIGTSSVTAGTNANVTGDVYVNGSISGLNVTGGSVIAANLVDPTTVESFYSGSSSAGLTSIKFWNKTPAVNDIAQSFKISSATPINAVTLYLQKTSGSWSGANIKIVNDNAGSPGSTVYASASLPSGSVSTSDFGDPYLPLNTTINLTPGVIYWIVADMPTQTSSTAYLLAQTVSSSTASYANGVVKTGTFGGTWSLPSGSTASDIFFALYYNGQISTVDNVTTSGSPYFIWAREIYNSNAGSGKLYCQNSSNSTPSVCDESRPDPTISGSIVTTNDYASWESSATSGTTTSSITVTSGGTKTLGNTKIVGNLNISNNAQANLTGNLWITGDLVLSNNSTLQIDPSMGAKDVVVLVDGSINLDNNANVLGSGNSNSFLLLVSRCTVSTCPSGSINLSNNATAGALVSPNGLINLSNNANAKAAVGQGVTMSNNANIIYDPKLQYFSLGATGATSSLWSIDSWQEVSQ